MSDGIILRTGNRGFFIVQDLNTNEELFCHFSKVIGNTEKIQPGLKVSFEVLPEKKEGKLRPISSLILE